MRLIKVRSLCGDKAAAHEVHRAHPNGQAAVDTPGVIYEVAATPFILGRVAIGFLEIVEDPEFEARERIAMPSRYRRSSKTTKKDEDSEDEDE